MNLNLKSMIFSNYISLIVRFIVMIILTRQMFTQLSHEQYGFWTLLWSIYAYSLLFDFGLGVCIQRKASQAYINKNWKSLTELLSTVFIVYCFIAILICISTLLLSLYIFDWFNFETAHSKDFISVLLIFGFGSACVFPFGVFSEILRGIHKVSIRNKIEACRELINASCIILALLLGGELIHIAVITVLVQLITNFIMALQVTKQVPSLKLFDFNCINFQLLKSQLNFSFSVYGITIANLIIFRTDQLIISIFMSVSYVALYHVANRLAELFKLIFNQVQDLFAPITSSLIESNRIEISRDFLRIAQKNMTLFTLLVFFPIFTMLETLLNLWLNISQENTLLTAKILLINMAIQIIFRNSIDQVLMMVGKHSSIMKINLSEALMNLGLSMVLIHFYGIVGVALATLIPNLLISLTISLFLYKNYLKTTYYQTLILCLKPIIVSLSIYFLFDGLFDALVLNTGFLTLLIKTAITALTMSIIFYIYFTTESEKSWITVQVKQIFSS